MGEKIPIFKPCTMEYKQWDKPIKYDDDFFNSLQCSIHGVKLLDKEHYGKSIGDVYNIDFYNGELRAEISSEKSLDGLKYSPGFDCSLVDKGDYYLATDGKLMEVTLTDSPRKAILLNTNDGGSNMGESEDVLVKTLKEELAAEHKKLAVAENKLKATEEKLSKYDELEKEVIELRKAKEDNEKLINEQKPIIDKFKEQQENQKQELLNKISDGNDAIKEKFKDFSIDQLQTIIETHSQESPANGVGTENAPGYNQGSGEESEEEKMEKDFEILDSMFNFKNKEE